MIRHPSTPTAAIAGAALLWAAVGLATPAEAASPVSPAAIASAATGQGNDFWEDRYNAMQKIWGTPYVPLGYYWDRVNGLPPRPAPVAPGVYSDRPVYPYGFGSPGFGHGYGRGHGRGYPAGLGYGYGYPGGLGYGPGYGYGPGLGYGGYPGIGINLSFGSRYGGFYGW